MSNMTPFEIRLELLKMARDMLYDEYNGQRDRISQNWNMQCESAKSKGENPPEHPGIAINPLRSRYYNQSSNLKWFRV
jgi:hypothetical protein